MGAPPGLAMGLAPSQQILRLNPWRWVSPSLLCLFIVNHPMTMMTLIAETGPARGGRTIRGDNPGRPAGVVGGGVGPVGSVGGRATAGARPTRGRRWAGAGLQPGRTTAGIGRGREGAGPDSDGRHEGGQ